MNDKLLLIRFVITGENRLFPCHVAQASIYAWEERSISTPSLRIFFRIFLIRISVLGLWNFRTSNFVLKNKSNFLFCQFRNQFENRIIGSCITGKGNVSLDAAKVGFVRHFRQKNELLIHYCPFMLHHKAFIGINRIFYAPKAPKIRFILL